MWQLLTANCNRLRWLVANCVNRRFNYVEQMLVAAGANKKSTNTLNKIPFDRICSYSGAKCTGEAREGLTELLRV